MSKAFKKDNDDQDDAVEEIAFPANVKNYMTPRGFELLQDELRHLFRDERPKLVEVISWAAKNGDRSENGDYIYGKRRLREIDRRIRYLTKRLESAEVVNPKLQQGLQKVFFGATVTYQKDDQTITVQLVGVDEADLTQGKISWLSPLAKALLRSEVGDVVVCRTPAGDEEVEVVSIEYRVF